MEFTRKASFLDKQNVLLDNIEFITMLRHTLKADHYPWLTILADDMHNIIYEGVKSDSHIIYHSNPANICMIVQLSSPKHIMLSTNNIQNFHMLNSTFVFWNKYHPLVKSFHNIIPVRKASNSEYPHWFCAEKAKLQAGF